jgi:hypothetical protein
VRVWAAWDDFWLDEIWSLEYFGLEAKSPFDILARMPESNNHHLVSLWMYVCGDRAQWFIYRVPSILAGVGTIALIWRIGCRWDRQTGIVAAALSGGSFFLITYASEARGYALAGFFSLAAFLMLDRFLRRPGWLPAFGFGVMVLLSHASHLTSVLFYAGALTWSAVALARKAASWKQAFLWFSQCHLVAIAGLVAFGAIALRNYTVGGAPPYVLSDVIVATLAVSLGIPRGPLVVVAAIATLALGLAGVVKLWQARDDVAVFFVTTIFAAPALVMLSRPSSLYERFFYLSVLFYLLPLSYVLMGYLRAGGWQRDLAFLALALIVVANGWQNVQFLRYGRGQYLNALRDIAKNSRSADITVQTDHDFRNQLMLSYYCSRFLNEYQWLYQPQDSPAERPTEWAILHSFDPNYVPASRIFDAHKHRYDFEKLYPYYGLSGFHWAVYRRADAAAQPSVGSP